MSQFDPAWSSKLLLQLLSRDSALSTGRPTLVMWQSRGGYLPAWDSEASRQCTDTVGPCPPFALAHTFASHLVSNGYRWLSSASYSDTLSRRLRSDMHTYRMEHCGMRLIVSGKSSRLRRSKVNSSRVDTGRVDGE